MSSCTCSELLKYSLSILGDAWYKFKRFLGCTIVIISYWEVNNLKKSLQLIKMVYYRFRALKASCKTSKTVQRTCMHLCMLSLLSNSDGFSSFLLSSRYLWQCAMYLSLSPFLPLTLQPERWLPNLTGTAGGLFLLKFFSSTHA